MSAEESTRQFDQFLEYVTQSRGFDFSACSQGALRHGIDQRLRALQVETYASYIEYLELHPDEYIALFNTVLPDVTGFFRDATTWEYLRDELLPEHLTQLATEHVIRVWSAGCATGEETYTLAIVLAEVLGLDEFTQRVRIYGTDIDDDALEIARAATYDTAAVAAIPAELRDRYLDRVGSGFRVRPEIRSSVIFGHLDVVQDAPISGIELLCCRNTLIYFDSETQGRVIDRFRFSLNRNAILMLGSTESLVAFGDLFGPVDAARRLFRKVAAPRREPQDHERVTRELEQQLQQVTRDLDEAYQEVQAANEELGATNQELQLTVDELEASTEALQSTNDELESINEDFHTVSDELRFRGEEIDDLSQFLQSVMDVRGAAAIVDTRRRVRVWTPRAEDLWGVSEKDVRGHLLETIESGLPVTMLLSALDTSLADERAAEVTVDAVTRLGRAVWCTVLITPLRAGTTLTGALLVMAVPEG